MRSIYATDPDNVYVVGHNDNPGTPTMFHYDGSRWTTTNFHSSAGGTISGAVSLSKVYGFGASDIWVAGERIYQIGNTFRDSSFLMHFDGTRWTEAMIAGGRGRLLQSLWGVTPTDIWAGGVNTLLHYDGAQWSHFPIDMPAQGIQFLSIAGFSASEVYMVGSRRDASGDNDTVAYLMFRFAGTAWTLIDSSIQVIGNPAPRFGPIFGVVDQTLYSVYQGVFQYTGGNWNTVFSPPFPLGGIGGTRSSHIFTVGGESQIYHYDGSTWYRYPQFQNPNTSYLSLWTNEETIFVVGNDGSTTFVARGR